MKTFRVWTVILDLVIAAVAFGIGGSLQIWWLVALGVIIVLLALNESRKLWRDRQRRD